MHPTSRISAYSNRWQGIMLVLHTLHELGGSNTKQQVIAHISQPGYYAVTKYDLPRYENHNEPKYHTLLAWTRKDCVARDLILDHEQDAWVLSREGRRKVDEIHRVFSKGEYDVRKCYLWTPKFKKILFPTYQPSVAEAKRPEKIFEEFLDSL
jgi:hypothetical protein